MIGVDEGPGRNGEGCVLQRGGFERQDLARPVDDQMVVSGLPARMSGPAARLGQIGSSQDGPRDKRPGYANSGIVGVDRVAALCEAGRVETDGRQQPSIGQSQEWGLMLRLGMDQV